MKEMRFRISLLGGSLIEKKYIWNDAVRRRSDRLFVYQFSQCGKRIIGGAIFSPSFRVLCFRNCRLRYLPARSLF